jgi:hypothetical protein
MLRQKREIQETLAWCVSIMVFHHNTRSTQGAAEVLLEDVRLVARWVQESDITHDEFIAHLMVPLKIELESRYGKAVGRMLHEEFFAAYSSDPLAFPLTCAK